jgi:hypothetical protein
MSAADRLIHPRSAWKRCSRKFATPSNSKDRFPALEDHPHACAGSGVVLIGTMVWDEDSGGEVEYLEAIPCRACAAAREDVSA